MHTNDPGNGRVENASEARGGTHDLSQGVARRSCFFALTGVKLLASQLSSPPISMESKILPTQELPALGMVFH